MRSNEEFARYIDATLLKPNVTQEDMRQHLEAARRFHFKTVAIGCAWIPYAKELLAESDVGIDAPIGFPNGYSTTESKVFETIDAFAKGATEADILINIGWLRSGRYAELEDELKRFVAAAGGKVTKVILENYYLTDEQKREGVRIVKRAGADFVKTSTGFAARRRDAGRCQAHGAGGGGFPAGQSIRRYPYPGVCRAASGYRGHAFGREQYAFADSVNNFCCVEMYIL